MYKEIRNLETGDLIGIEKNCGRRGFKSFKVGHEEYWPEYQEWLSDGNTPAPMMTPEKEAIRAENLAKLDQKDMIKDKMEDLAIAELKKEGKLPDDYEKEKS
jgi:hypothetical protein